VRAFLKTANPEDESFLMAVGARPESLLSFTDDVGAPQNSLRAARAEVSTALIDAVCLGLNRCASPERALSFLPLCHIYERTLINIYVYLGTSVFFAQNLNSVGEDLRDVRPHIFGTVPRLLEKIYEKIVARGSQLSGLNKALFVWALHLAWQFEPGASIHWLRRMKLAVADRLIYARWRKALGGRIRAIVSGSAALQPRLARVFCAARMPVYEGYGPTEASPVISVNYPGKGRYKIGTVGPVISGGEVKIAADGEILYRGPNVMMGYYHRPELTAESIDGDGWLHTGDVGEFDGIFLKITDRKKEIFKTSGGKYIAPQQIENRMKESKFIAQIMIVGENRRFPAALIVPEFQAVADHFRARGVALRSNCEMVSNREVKALFEAEIRRLNEHFGHYAQVKKFILLTKEWSLAEGELTPTLKLKRRSLLKKYAKEVEALYDSTEQTDGPPQTRADHDLPRRHQHQHHQHHPLRRAAREG